MVNKSLYEKRAKYYDIEYVPLDDTRFLNKYIDNNVTRLLEIPCGSGFHLEWLLSTEKYIYLIDKEVEMVNIVRNKVECFGVRERVNVINGIMDSFTLPEKVDLIIFPQESFQFLLSDKQVIDTLNNAYKNLNHRGIVIIDIADFDRKIDIDIKNTPKYWQPSRKEGKYYRDWNRQIDSRMSLLRDSAYTETRSDIIFSFHYQVHCDTLCIEEYDSSITLRKHKYESLLELIQSTEFIINNVLGSYSSKIYQPEDPRIIFILCKNEN